MLSFREAHHPVWLWLLIFVGFQSKIPFTGSENHCSESSAFPGAISFLLTKRGFKRRKSLEIKTVVVISVKGSLLASEV